MKSYSQLQVDPNDDLGFANHVTKDSYNHDSDIDSIDDKKKEIKKKAIKLEKKKKLLEKRKRSDGDDDNNDDVFDDDDDDDDSRGKKSSKKSKTQIDQPLATLLNLNTNETRFQVSLI